MHPHTTPAPARARPPARGSDASSADEQAADECRRLRIANERLAGVSAGARRTAPGGYVVEAAGFRRLCSDIEALERFTIEAAPR